MYRPVVRETIRAKAAEVTFKEGKSALKEGRKVLFKRKPADAPPPPAVKAAPPDLGQVAELIERFERSMGDADAMLASLLAIAIAGGASRVEDALMDLGAGRESGLARPWYWLSAAAREAERQQNWTLIAHLALFTVFWKTTLLPRLGPGDVAEIRLEDIPPYVLAEQVTLFLRALHRRDPGARLVEDSQGGANVYGVLRGCALLALEKPALFDLDTIAIAGYYQ